MRDRFVSGHRKTSVNSPGRLNDHERILTCYAAREKFTVQLAGCIMSWRAKTWTLNWNVVPSFSSYLRDLCVSAVYHVHTPSQRCRGRREGAENFKLRRNRQGHNFLTGGQRAC